MRSFLARKRLVLVFVLALAALGAAGGGWYYYTRYLPAQRPSAAETIQTARVRRGSLIIAVGGSGTLMPAAEVDLGFSSGGVLSELLVEVGDWVESGQVLARIDPAALERAVTQAEADLSVAQDNVENA